jgi:molybdate transport system substrate-binding protein
MGKAPKVKTWFHKRALGQPFAVHAPFCENRRCLVRQPTIFHCPQASCFTFAASGYQAVTKPKIMPVFDQCPCVKPATKGLGRRGILRLAGLGVGMGVGAFALPGRGQNTSGGVMQQIRVLAASDLKFALADVLNQFHKDTGLPVIATYGSSGQFARQIAQGLPGDLFMSADEALVEQLAASGHTQGRGAVYAQGRLALIVPRSSGLRLDGGWEAALAEFKQGLTQKTIAKLAIANPEHAPYGRAAQQALTALGLWDSVQTRLVLGDNIAQATQFVTTGAAQAGLTALSLAVAPEVAASTRHVQVPQHLHTALRQRMVLLKNARPQAQQLQDYLQTNAVRQRLQQLGFARP